MVFQFNGNKINAQTVWTGPKTTFTKANYANWSLEANQDRISKVFLILKLTKPTCINGVPGDTEWAYGTTAEYTSLTHQTLGNLIVVSQTL